MNSMIPNSSAEKVSRITVMSWPKAVFMACGEIFATTRKLRELPFKMFMAFSLSFPPIWFYMGGSAVKDYSVPVPSLSEANFIEGRLSLVRIAKQSVWEVTDKKGQKIYLERNDYKWRPDPESSNPIVRIFWYKLQSGIGRVIQMEKDEKIIIDPSYAESTRRKNLQNFTRTIYYAIALWLIGFAILIHKASRIRNNPVISKEESK